MGMSVTRYRVERGAAWITLAAPETRNALTAPLVAELSAHLRGAIRDPAVRVIVLTGEGTAFCAGADLKNRGDMGAPGERGGNPLVDILQMMRDGPKPVVCAVNGAAFGGGVGLVAAGDIAIASHSARFSFSEVRLGLIPAMISVVVLPKLGEHLSGALTFALRNVTDEEFDDFGVRGAGVLHEAVTPTRTRA